MKEVLDSSELSRTQSFMPTRTYENGFERILVILDQNHPAIASTHETVLQELDSTGQARLSNSRL